MKIKTVIGLGSAGCNIAEKFEQLENYKILLFDDEIEGDNCFSLPTRYSPEEYELAVPENLDILQPENIEDDILFIVGGSGKISCASLKILEQIKTKKINVLYIKPDSDLLSSTGMMLDRLVFNVLQEYTKSNLFYRFIIIKNSILEDILGDLPLVGYYDKINELIFYTLNNINILESTEAILDNSSTPKETSRICTVGVYDIESGNERLFFPLDNTEDKVYHFFINKEKLKTDGKLYKKIKEGMREKVLDNLKISYTIHQSDNAENYCYIIAYTKFKQS